MERLTPLTQELKSDSAKVAAGRFCQAVAIGKGDLGARSPQAEMANRMLQLEYAKAGVSGLSTDDFTKVPDLVSTAVLAALRDVFIPAQLIGLRKVPPLTRIFMNAQGVVGVVVADSSPIPILRGDFSTEVLEPKKIAGITLITDELARATSPQAAAAIVDDLVQGVAEAGNKVFVDPNETGSILDGAEHFDASGSALANIDTDLRRLIGLVGGTRRRGAAFIMAKDTAAYLATVRGSGGAAAFPDVGPQGGSLLKLPVLISEFATVDDSPRSAIVALVSPQEIFWTDTPRVTITASTAAGLEMSDSPTGNTAAPSAASENIVSLFQAECTALKAVIEVGWYARSGAAAYYVAGY